MRVRGEILEREVTELQLRNEELTSLAQEAQALKDEMDILRWDIELDAEAKTVQASSQGVGGHFLQFSGTKWARRCFRPVPMYLIYNKFARQVIKSETRIQ